jgi:hypothetical protein
LLSDEGPAKAKFSLAQVQEALHNLSYISTAAEAVSERLKTAIETHKKWRWEHLILASTDISGLGGKRCNKCELPRWDYGVVKDRKNYLCNFCPRCGCFGGPVRRKMAVGYSTAAGTGSASAPCFYDLGLESIENDMYHISITHMALRVTLERLVKDSRFSSQKNQLKMAEALLFGFKLFGGVAFAFSFDETCETISYWLDLEQVLQDWGWVIPPPALPRSWEEARELCAVEVKKAKRYEKSILEEYNARLVIVGTMISPGDIRSAGFEDSACSRDISLEVDIRAAQEQQGWEEMQKKHGWKDQPKKRRTSTNWMEISIVLMNKIRRRDSDGYSRGDGDGRGRTRAERYEEIVKVEEAMM